ncbi:hypothetical protein D3C71_1348340 [compost metagenome]
MPTRSLMRRVCDSVHRPSRPRWCAPGSTHCPAAQVKRLRAALHRPSKPRCCPRWNFLHPPYLPAPRGPQNPAHGRVPLHWPLVASPWARRCWAGAPPSRPRCRRRARRSTTPPPSNAAACWPLRATAWCATPHRAARPTRGAAPWTPRLARSTPPTSRPTPRPASASGPSAPSSAPCAKASRAMAATCTPRSPTPRSPR